MIIYGSRMYFKKNRVVSFGKCDSCGKYGKQQNYDARKFGHLYFIPLIPEGKAVRVVGECAKCKIGTHIPVANVGELQDATVDGVLKDCDRLRAGEREYTDEGGKQDAAANIAGAVGMIYRLAGKGDAETLMNEVRGAGDAGATALAEASLCKVQGDVDAAVQHYRTAEQAMPASAVPVYLRGGLLASVGRPEEAAEALERAAAMAPDDVGIKLELVDVCTNAKRFDRAAELFDAAFALVPALAGDKKLVKLYKRACKKAGRPATAAR